MTERWCFTCDHELKQDIDGNWVHVYPDDEEDCPCTEDGLECEPR